MSGLYSLVICWAETNSNQHASETERCFTSEIISMQYCTCKQIQFHNYVHIQWTLDYLNPSGYSRKLRCLDNRGSDNREATVSWHLHMYTAAQITNAVQQVKHQSSSPPPFICENKADEMSVVTKKAIMRNRARYHNSLKNPPTWGHERSKEHNWHVYVCVHWVADRTVSKVMWPRSNRSVCVYSSMTHLFLAALQHALASPLIQYQQNLI